MGVQKEIEMKEKEGLECCEHCGVELTMLGECNFFECDETN